MVLTDSVRWQVRSVKSMLDGTAVEINLQAREQAISAFFGTLRNTGKEPVQIGDIVLFSHQEDETVTIRPASNGLPVLDSKTPWPTTMSAKCQQKGWLRTYQQTLC